MVPAPAAGDTERQQDEAATAALDLAAREAMQEFSMSWPSWRGRFHRLAHWAEEKGARLCVLVDNFDALYPLSALNNHAASTLRGRHRPLGSFFQTFKTLHGYGLLGRMFLTGVSPAAWQEMGSALHHASDVSDFGNMSSALGFTAADVRRATEECLGFSAGSTEQELVLETLRHWSGEYRFSDSYGTPVEGVYHTATVAQLIQHLQSNLYCSPSSNGKQPASDTASEVRRVLRSWAPDKPSTMDRVLGHFASASRAASNAVDRVLLPKLASGRSLVSPNPLDALTLSQQLGLPATSVPCFEPPAEGFAQALTAPAWLPPLSWMEPAEATLVRTLYYEGLLTRDGASCNMLRVPSQAMHDRLMERLAKGSLDIHPRMNTESLRRPCGAS